MVTLAVLCTAAPSRAQEAIFRAISVQPFGSISLGEPYEQAGRLGEEIRPGVFELPPDFGGTDAIFVVLSDAGVVSSLVFQYPPTEAVTDAGTLTDAVTDTGHGRGRGHGRDRAHCPMGPCPNSGCHG